jgi:hypothetical protein
MRPSVPKIATPSANIGSGLAETEPEVATTNLTVPQESLTTTSPSPPETKPNTAATGPAAREDSLTPASSSEQETTPEETTGNAPAEQESITTAAESSEFIFCGIALTEVSLSSKSPLPNAQLQAFIDSVITPSESTIPVASQEPPNIIKVRSIAPEDEADENGCHGGTV